MSFGIYKDMDNKIIVEDDRILFAMDSMGCVYTSALIVTTDHIYSCYLYSVRFVKKLKIYNVVYKLKG